MLYVLESKGSSPGRQGFMMAVTQSGQIAGSLGGGIMEHKFVEMAKSKLQNQATETSVHKQVHNKTAPQHQSGMICSGEQTIFLYAVKKEEKGVVENIITVLQQNKNASLQLSFNGIAFSYSIPDSHYQLQLLQDGNFIFTEKLGYKHSLYIIGGGHCSLALSQLMSSMDFYIYLFDHREQLNTVQQNNLVHEKKLLTDFSELSTLIPSSKNSFVVIMTVGYRTDALAIKALQEKEFAYIGVLGSKSKMTQLLQQLEAEGVNKSWLANIYAPIGIPIKSQTTAEIAVSIAAEIIQVKNS